MTAIDPDSCQLVEVPIDASGTIVVQDPSALIAGGQVQVGGIVQTGKSILKPELAQHLIQPIGIRASYVSFLWLSVSFRFSCLPWIKSVIIATG